MDGTEPEIDDRRGGAGFAQIGSQDFGVARFLP
jgi:hypothetical protein